MKSDAIVESVIEKDFRFVVRKQRPMQEQEKVLRELLQTRRNNSWQLYNFKFKKVG